MPFCLWPFWALQQGTEMGVGGGSGPSHSMGQEVSQHPDHLEGEQETGTQAQEEPQRDEREKRPRKGKVAWAGRKRVTVGK